MTYFKLINLLGIYMNSNCSGDANWNDEWKEFKVEAPLDNATSRALMEHLLGDGIKAEGITSFGGFPTPIRWGEVVPLWFIRKDLKNTKVVIITTPARLGTTSGDRSKNAK